MADHPARARCPGHRAQQRQGGESGRQARPVRQEAARTVAIGVPAADDTLVRRFLSALSEGDTEAVGGLVHPEVEIHTARTVHRGREAAVDWAGTSYDHLFRRYAPEAIEPADHGVLVRAAVEYVWRETGEVGDSSPVEIELAIQDGLIRFWRLEDVPVLG